MRKRIGLSVLVLLIGVVGTAHPGVPTGPVQIGLIRTMFRDTPEAIIATLTRPLRSLLETQTGMQGEWKIVSDALTTARQLENGELHLAVLHSFEYGWARQANPKIRALVVANRVSRDSRFALVVGRDSAAKTPADLKGTRLAIPLLTREPGHLFLDVKCCANCPPADFFKATLAAGDAEEALDQVILTEADGALVEKSALDAYLKAKPKQVKNLRILALSEDFPNGVLVYREGQLPEETLQAFRTGLLNANSNPKSRTLLKLAQLNGFDRVPASYEAEIEELPNGYPAPAKRGYAPIRPFPSASRDDHDSVASPFLCACNLNVSPV